MQKVELVFIPTPGAGHLASAVETAKLLISQEKLLSVSVLITKFPLDPKLSLPSSSDPRLRFIDLPDVEFRTSGNSPGTILGPLIEAQKPIVKRIASNIIESESTQLAGFVLDMFCTSMIDVANELDPSNSVAQIIEKEMAQEVQATMSIFKQNVPADGSTSNLKLF